MKALSILIIIAAMLYVGSSFAKVGVEAIGDRHSQIEAIFAESK